MAADTCFAGRSRPAGPSSAGGTLIVTALHVRLNLVLQRTMPLADLVVRLDVGALSAEHVFAPIGGLPVSAVICVLPLSTILAGVFPAWRHKRRGH